MFNEADQSFIDGDPMSGEHLEGLRRLIGQNRTALDLLLESADKTCFQYGDPDVKSWERTIPNAVKMIRAVRLLGFEAAFMADEGDIEGAVALLRRGFGFAPKPGEEGLLISFLLAVADMKHLLFCLNEVVSDREADTDLLLRIIDDFDSRLVGRWRENFASSFRSERILYVEIGMEFASERLPRWVLGDAEYPEAFFRWLIRPFIKRDIAKKLPLYAELEEMARLPYFRAREEFEAYREKMDRLPWYSVVSRLVLPNAEAAFLKLASLEALVLTARTGLACRVFKARNGRFPDDLSELVPSLIPETPIDPFTGSPLMYRKAGEGFVVYSLGSNQKDDGGRTMWKITRLVEDKDDDWVWRESE